MTTAYELTYTQTIRLASGVEQSEVTAGFVTDKAQADSWKAADERNSFHVVQLSDDDMWMVGS